jgi:hypothetical protein
MEIMKEFSGKLSFETLSEEIGKAATIDCFKIACQMIQLNFIYAGYLADVFSAILSKLPAFFCLPALVAFSGLFRKQLIKRITPGYFLKKDIFILSPAKPPIPLLTNLFTPLDPII